MDHETQELDIKSVRDGAKLIGVSQVTLHRLMKRGEIGFYKIGSRTVLSKEKHLLPFLQKNERIPVTGDIAGTIKG